MRVKAYSVSQCMQLRHFIRPTCLCEQVISNTCKYFTMYCSLSDFFIAMISIHLILYELISVS